jgi:hypothetical protein
VNGNNSVTEPHHFYAVPAPGKNSEAAPAPALFFETNKSEKLLQFVTF